MTCTRSKATRSEWLRRAAIGLTAAVLLATPALADDSAEAQAVVKETIDRVLEILASEDLGVDRRRERIEQIAYDRFDFATISRLVLGRRWKGFSPEQREEFVDQFKTHLSRNYGSRIERYEQEEVAILSRRVEPRGDVTVRTRIEGGQADGIEIDYRLRKRDGPWLVIDVVIEGVSLVSSYRSQFSEILGRGGPTELLEELREKNAKTSRG